jgi:hypothetical protein
LVLHTKSAIGLYIATLIAQVLLLTAIRDASTANAVAGLGAVVWVAYVWQDAKRNQQAGWWWFVTGITGGLAGPLYVWYRDDRGPAYRERVERRRKERDEQLDRQAGL